MTVTAGRHAALQVLRAVRRGDLAGAALASALADLAAEERAWAQELAYGTLRLRGRLDYLLDRMVRRGVDSLDDDVLDVLRLGAYQLLEMHSVPDYAAVSQAVDQAGPSGSGHARLVNAVLRGLVREQDAIRFPSFEEEPAAHLSAWGSHPLWLVERWLARFGPESTRALVEANNTRPEQYLRPVGCSLDEAMRRLEAAGMEARPVPFAPRSLRLLRGSAAEALRAVPAVIQDPAAGLVVDFAAPSPGDLVADLCAAPGGKALGLAERVAGPPEAVQGRCGRGLGDEGVRVIAADVSAGRLARVRENLDRVGPAPVRLLLADARRPALRRADLVLVDAPCTGTGTFRRHADGKWRVGPGDLEALAALQVEMLDAAAGIVAPGGLLVYATCSLEPEENELQVDRFLTRNPEFELAPPPPGIDARTLDGAGRLYVLPHRLGVDAAFAARLRRRP